jgi:GH24 family phage-related lysozyme (muramidase)
MSAAVEARVCAWCDEPMGDDQRGDAKTHRGSCRDNYKRQQRELRDDGTTRERINAFWGRYPRLRAGRKGKTAQAGRAVRDALYAGVSMLVALLLLAAAAPATFGAVPPSTQAAITKAVDVPVSDADVRFIEDWESFRATCYDDGAGNATIAIGELLHPGACTAADNQLRYTLAKGRALLRKRLAREYLPAVVRAAKLAKWKLTATMRRAALSWTYNLGPGWVGSTVNFRTLWSKFRARDQRGVGEALLLYVNPGTAVEVGLRRRRKSERSLWLRNLADQGVSAKPQKATPDISRVKKPPKTAPVGSPKSDNRCVYTLPLARGSKGRDVKVIQLAMRKHGLGLKVTSVFDVPTKKSVRTIQRRARLKQDGVVGSKTLAKLDLSRCPEPKPSVRACRTTVALDGTPTYKCLALVLQDAKRNGWPGTLTAADRRRGVPEKFGRSSQWALYQCWIARRPGCNPANPPGRSTHEQRSDGFAYAGPPGRVLEWWQLGEDVTYPETLVVKLRALGYNARRPYPDSREAQHVNLYTNPTGRLQARGLVAR